jgi:hypothetical protein
VPSFSSDMAAASCDWKTQPNGAELAGPLERLQLLGCGRPNDLITTRPINDTQLQAILAEAFRRGR